MRALVLALAGLGLAVVPVPPAAASAAAQTCQGQPATIETAGPTAMGTDGNDVIVATGAHVFAVNGFGGDDLICVTGTLRTDIYDYSSILGGPGHDSVLVRGGPDRDFLVLWNDVERLDVALGGGFDKMRIYNRLGPGGTGVVDGGPDGGALQLLEFMRTVRVDLEDQLMRLDGTGRYEVSRFSRVAASARRVVMDGDRRANGLAAAGCRVVLQGGRGDDVLVAVTPRKSTCEPRGATVLGQRGADRLEGTTKADVLLGGMGRDRVNGFAGRDRCVAEAEKGCER